MKKRGQLSLFLVLGLVILVIAGLFFYISNYIPKKGIASGNQKNIAPTGIDAVRAYANNCLKYYSEDAILNRLAEHSGYIDPDGNQDYGEEGAHGPPPALYQQKKVFYYLEKARISGSNVYNKYLPDYKKKFENYVAVEFDKCIKRNTFGDIGIKITSPYVDFKSVNFDFTKTPVNVVATFNDEDVIIDMTYPMTVESKQGIAKLSELKAVLPIRFKLLYGWAGKIIDRAKEENEKGETSEYDISLDCSSLYNDDEINVNVVDSQDGKKEIVKLTDFSTFRRNYFSSLVLKFAVKDIKIKGSC